jgi:hypothetical protein
MGIVSTSRKDQELKVVFNDDTLLITPDNGKEIAFPLLWHPQLKNASEEEKRNWYLSKDGRRLIWEKLGVEISF